MVYNRIITENILDAWVRSNAQDAQGVIVELVWRLVAASSQNPKERRFPLGDSIGQPGPDGKLNTEFGFEPFVPEGESIWEIGTGEKTQAKATSDYNDLVKTVSLEIRQRSTFVFVTPLSGRKGWKYTWKENAQISWRNTRLQREEWRDVRIIDGTVLIDWLQHFPAVEVWLAGKMELPAQQLQTPEQRWEEIRMIDQSSPLLPSLFLENRDEACAKLRNVISGAEIDLKIDTHFPEQIQDFVAAFFVNLNDNERIEAIGRCLIISSVDAWNYAIMQRDPQILIANFDLNEIESIGSNLFEKARQAGHSVIFGGLPGGMPYRNRVTLPNPGKNHIRVSLEKAGFEFERARLLAQKSGGNLSSLLRCLQNLPLAPDWAQQKDAADLVVAELLGSWNEKFEADCTVVENLSGKSYLEWIAKMREIALRLGTPLTQREGIWKFSTRYEGWLVLGPKIFDDHLDNLKKVAVLVLQEKDPKFDLPPDERWVASLHGKVPLYSPALRQGLSESLALLGSHPEALISCSCGKAETTAELAVREILTDGDWTLWATLDRLLPLLAETAPREFLKKVKEALNSEPCPFDNLFLQEGFGGIEDTYIAGLLWALETLAWDEEYFISVISILGNLAARDPGGNWNNRPKNSLTTILLPLFPQTCARINKRRMTVEMLIQEQPDVVWNLLISLLPQPHPTILSGSYRPVWRNIIPENWSQVVTTREYREQIIIYFELMIEIAKGDLGKLTEIIDHYNLLPPSAQKKFLAYLGSSEIQLISEVERLPLWNELVDLVSKHRKHADAKWAMKPEHVDAIDAVANQLTPTTPSILHRRLFSNRGRVLYDGKGDFKEQQKQIRRSQQDAIDEIFSIGGVPAVLQFVRSVDSARDVGIAFGMNQCHDVDLAVLPDLLSTEEQSLKVFTGGFVGSRFESQGGWQWADEINISTWEPAQIGQFLAYFPFSSDTWDRCSRFLGSNISEYWIRTENYLYAVDKHLEIAVDRLIKYGRPLEAVRCIYTSYDDEHPFDSNLVIRALLAASHTLTTQIDDHEIIELIKKFQGDPTTNADDLFKVEWAYLPLLFRSHDASPIIMEWRLAERPEFFCEVFRTVFRSSKEEPMTEASTKKDQIIATNAYRLLSRWSTPPGSQRDGSFDGARLTEWLDAVRKECTETGHLDSAMSEIGKVLTHAPPDPDGLLWIHPSAASVLDAEDADEMREGFKTQLFNSGDAHAHYGMTGQEERELALNSRSQADEVENAGFLRLADALRVLAKESEHFAKWESSRFPCED